MSDGGLQKWPASGGGAQLQMAWAYLSRRVSSGGGLSHAEAPRGRACHDSVGLRERWSTITHRRASRRRSRAGREQPALPMATFKTVISFYSTTSLVFFEIVPLFQFLFLYVCAVFSFFSCVSWLGVRTVRTCLRCRNTRASQNKETLPPFPCPLFPVGKW